jgi:diamine N-acetyltransferase
MDAPVSPREITRDTLRAIYALAVDESQQRNVAPNAVSLAEAWLYPHEAWPRAIYAGDEAVGFVMVYDPTSVAQPEEDDWFLWRLMVDRRHQGGGHGRAAVGLVIDHVRSRDAQRLMVSHVRDDARLGRFYQSFGFVYSGREEERERYMVLPLV